MTASSLSFRGVCEDDLYTSVMHGLVANNNNNNELYLHGHKRDLQRCKSILTITITKSKSNDYQTFDN